MSAYFVMVTDFEGRFTRFIPAATEQKASTEVAQWRQAKLQADTILDWQLARFVKAVENAGFQVIQ